MRKEYRKAVRARFIRSLSSALPGFELAKVRSPLLFGGETVFRWTVADTLHCFVILAPDPKGRQAFTVELAWSTAGRFPEGSARPTLVLGPGAPWPVDVPEGIVRLGDVRDGQDAWWSLPDPALERPGSLEALQESVAPVTPAAAMDRAEAPVDTAILALVDGGVGFFEMLAGRHGHDGATPRRAT
jgi:hypothetical protein